MSSQVVVLGGNGMLGRQVRKQLEADQFMVITSFRDGPNKLDVTGDSLFDFFDSLPLESNATVINCIGVTKPHIDESSSKSIQRAVEVNAVFPHRLNQVAQDMGLKVIQVATDCVFSGASGSYVEADIHDAYDVYGKTKSLGEVDSKVFMILRCSLVGPEAPGRSSLLFDWVRGIGFGETVNGFTNHRWNGLTSIAFAKVVSGIIRTDSFVPGTRHLVPADELSKYELIKMELDLLQRSDVIVRPIDAETRINRSLRTNFEYENVELWRLAGYDGPPSIRDMMEEIPWDELRKSSDGFATD